MEIKPFFIPATQPQIAAFEQQAGVALPAAYRKFLETKNGGFPDPDTIKVKGFGDTMIKEFFGLGDDKYKSLEARLVLYRDRMPEAFLPIAYEGTGSLLILGISGEYSGQVWFWDHNQESDTGEKPGFQNLVYVAANLEELFAQFFEPEYDEPAKPAEELIFRSGDFASMKALIDSGWDVNTPLDRNERAILILCSMKPAKLEAAQMLVDAGANLDGCLDRVLFAKNTEMLEFLLKQGVNPNETNSNGNPWLSQAIISKQPEAAKRLIAHGADPSLKNSNGRTALEVAKLKFKQGAKELEELITILEKYP